MSDQEAWVRFAAALVLGMIADGTVVPAAVRIAPEAADALLAEFRKRFPATG